MSRLKGSTICHYCYQSFTLVRAMLSKDGNQVTVDSCWRSVSFFGRCVGVRTGGGREEHAGSHHQKWRAKSVESNGL